MEQQSMMVPTQLVAAVQSLTAEYARLYRDKTTAGICLDVQVTSGGVRDKNITVKTKIT